MSRYADIEWLKTEFDEANEICFFYLNADSRGAFEELKKIVEQAPSIDIVRCGECKKLEDCRHDSWQKGVIDMGYVGWCERTSRLGDVTYVKASDFCSYGERK